MRDWQNTLQESYIYIGKGTGTHIFFTLRSEVDEYTDIFCGFIYDVKARGVTPIVVRGTGKYYMVCTNDKNVISVCRRYSEAMQDMQKSAMRNTYMLVQSLRRDFVK